MSRRFNSVGGFADGLRQLLPSLRRPPRVLLSALGELGAGLRSKLSGRLGADALPPPQVELAPGSGGAMTAIMAQLLRDNLADRVEKRRDCAAIRGRVAIIAEDIDSSVTLHFEAGRVTVHDGIVGIPDLSVRGPSDLILELSRLQLQSYLRLPDPFSATAKSLFEAMRSGRLKVHGAWSHLPTALRLTRLLSVS